MKMLDKKGEIIAISIILLWSISLWTALNIEYYFSCMNTSLWISIIVRFGVQLFQSFLYTGLFITAHDAMHGAVSPRNKKLNAILGMTAVRLYAMFSYKKLWTKHWEHHRFSAQSGKDPDFHNGIQRGFWAWYIHFLRNYVSVGQILWMAVVFNILHHIVHISLQNLLLFWVAPAVLSTLQLFYFGTYLPHREHENGYENERHRARSNNFPVWLSFLTCYHFGYHSEHHESPSTPWWKLPEKRARIKT